MKAPLQELQMRSVPHVFKQATMLACLTADNCWMFTSPYRSIPLHLHQYQNAGTTLLFPEVFSRVLFRLSEGHRQVSTRVRRRTDSSDAEKVYHTRSSKSESLSFRQVSTTSTCNFGCMDRPGTSLVRLGGVECLTHSVASRSFCLLFAGQGSSALQIPPWVFRQTRTRSRHRRG